MTNENKKILLMLLEGIAENVTLAKGAIRMETDESRLMLIVKTIKHSVDVMHMSLTLHEGAKALLQDIAKAKEQRRSNVVALRGGVAQEGKGD